MAFIIVERLKDMFGKDKEACQIYQELTGKDMTKLYLETLSGDDVQKGTLFEYYIFKQLYKMKGHHRFLFNVILPTEKGTTEIDVLFLHETGIYVYECKNYSGKIYGNEKYKMWNQYLGGKKNQFYNPILQNQGHINNLKNKLNEKEQENIFSFVVFSERAEVKVEFEAKRLFVGITDDCIMENKILIKKLPAVFSEREIEDLFERLRDYTTYTEEQKQEHIDFVNNIKQEE